MQPDEFTNEGFSLVPNPEIWPPTDQYERPVCLADSFRLVIEIGRKKLMLPHSTRSPT